MKIAYIAGPFRAKTPWGVAENVRAAERVGLQVAQAGVMPLIPHANTRHFDGELPDQFWLDGTLSLLAAVRAVGGCVVILPTWQRSAGCKAEVAWALEHSMPVFGADLMSDSWEAFRWWAAEA